MWLQFERGDITSTNRRGETLTGGYSITSGRGHAAETRSRANSLCRSMAASRRCRVVSRAKPDAIGDLPPSGQAAFAHVNRPASMDDGDGQDATPWGSRVVRQAISF